MKNIIIIIIIIINDIHDIHHPPTTAEERHARAKDQFVGADLQRNSSWNSMYQQLLDYKLAHNGDVLVLTSKDSLPDVKKLSKWVQNQRVHYKYYMNGDTKHIKKHRIDALNKVRAVAQLLYIVG
jgi:hypothetical protein